MPHTQHTVLAILVVVVVKTFCISYASLRAASVSIFVLAVAQLSVRSGWRR